MTFCVGGKASRKTRVSEYVIIYHIAVEFVAEIDLRKVVISFWLFPFLVLRPFGSAPWTANASRLCNIQLAMKAVLSACSNYATKTRQCAHSDCPRIIHERERSSLHWSVKCSVWRRHPFSCLAFPNESQPQRPPCGRQIAALPSRLSVWR